MSKLHDKAFKLFWKILSLILHLKANSHFNDRRQPMATHIFSGFVRSVLLVLASSQTFYNSTNDKWTCSDAICRVVRTVEVMYCNLTNVGI